MNSTSTAPSRRCEGAQGQADIRQNPDRNHREGRRSYWGDKICSKQSNAVRILFGNVNSLGQSRTSEKMVHLEDSMRHYDVDFMAMAETGVNWKLLPAEDRLWERVQYWFEDRRIVYGYNSTDRLSPRSQYGGTAIIGRNDMVTKIHSSGRDKANLGRWCWLRIQGKNQVMTRIVSAYCPCQSTPEGSQGVATVYAQQLRALSTDPLQAFWDDLETEIRDWREEGDHVILCGDWNRKVNGAFMTSFMMSLGLEEALHHVHGTDVPPTYQRGRNCIDGIFVTSAILGCRGGMLPFGDIPGDHRGLWLDVPQELFLGYRMPKIPPRKIRLLQCSDVKAKERYKTLLHSLYLKHGVYGQIYTLREQVSYPASPSFKLQYDKLDRKVEKLKHEAASKCKKRRFGGKAFSDTLQDARRNIHLWSLVCKRLKGCHINARTIIRARKKTKVKNSNVSLDEAKTQLDLAFRHYRAVKKQDRQHRLAFQHKLSEERAAAGNIKVSTEIKNQTLREAQRRMARRTKYTLKRNQRCGTTMIQITNDTGTQDIINKAEMEDLIIAENKRKYHQTENWCPLLKGQLLEDIGILGDGPAVESILSGTYVCPEDTPPVVRLWLENLVIKDTESKTETLQTFREYRQGWKYAREFTSSGELHFGHFKAEAEHDMLAWSNYVLAGIPRVTGICPDRWKRGTDVMLLKKEGLFLLEKLRTIVLFESDFNFENKRLGREAMRLALEKGLITDEQYSRPGRSSQDNALNKHLMFDYARLRRQPFAVCACDLKSCYDRIVHNAATLALRRAGVRQSDIESMFGTIQQMIHKVRTAFGDSEQTYSADNPEFLHPTQGTCQGNGAGPSIWSIVCSTIFEILHDQGFGSVFCYALSRGLYCLCGFAYVDDCDLFYLGNDVDAVFEGLQAMLTLWDQLMEVTGAAIAPDKCWWYLVTFTWNGGRWSYSDEGQAFDLIVRNKDGVHEKLKYLTSDLAMEMLGVYLAPDGNEREQISQMRQKSELWGTYMQEGTLRDFEAWNALNTTILKSLEYPLVATSLCKKAIKHVLSPALCSGLQSAGFGKSFPRDILYAPSDMQGLGVTNLYHKQFIRHIKDIVDQTWRSTPSEKFIALNLEAFKLEAGVEGYLFESTCDITWTNTPSLWVAATLQYCQQYGIRFKEPGQVLVKKRVRDVVLMSAIALYNFTPAVLQSVNRCRIYLRVTTLSDICTADGRALHPFLTLRQPFGIRDRFSWPAQGRPDSTDWKRWDAVLHTVVVQSGVLGRGLGHWDLSHESYLLDWDYFITDSGDLVQHSTDGWRYFVLRGTARGRMRTYNLSTFRRYSRQPPRGIVRRTTIHQRGQLAVTHGESFNVLPITDSISIPRPTFEDALNTFPDAEWACSNLKGLANLDRLRQAIERGDAVAVSDGSAHKGLKLGSMAWIFADATDTWSIEGGGLIPGAREGNDSFRSEAGGLLGIVLVLAALTKLEYKGHIMVMCDGKSALSRAIRTNRFAFSSSNPSFDLISRIIALRDNLSMEISGSHVHGHQDDITDILSLPAALNVKMDARAKQYIHCAKMQNFVPPASLPDAPYGISQVHTTDKTISTHLEKSLLHWVSFMDAKDWWISKGRFSLVTASHIDWDVVKGTTSSMTFHQKRFLSKWVSNQLPTGDFQRTKRLQESAACPRCGMDHETVDHVSRCPQKHSHRIWHCHLRQLDTWLRRQDTDPDIIRVVILALPRWRAGVLTSAFCPHSVSDNVRAAVNEQHRIGWDNFMSGLLSKRWARCQEEYYRTKKNRKTGHRWAIRLSTRLWMYHKAQWTHRNSVRYKQQNRDALHGRQELLYACQVELDLGLQGLEKVFASYFETDIDILEEESTSFVKAWFATIRKAREESGYSYHNHDRISDSLRQWVGLRMDKQFQKE